MQCLEKRALFLRRERERKKILLSFSFLGKYILSSCVPQRFIARPWKEFDTFPTFLNHSRFGHNSRRRKMQNEKSTASVWKPVLRSLDCGSFFSIPNLDVLKPRARQEQFIYICFFLPSSLSLSQLPLYGASLTYVVFSLGLWHWSSHKLQPSRLTGFCAYMASSAC